MQLQTNEAHYANANKWNTPSTKKKIMQCKNDAHYTTANKWSAQCNCKQIKQTMQIKTNKLHNSTANK